MSIERCPCEASVAAGTRSSRVAGDVLRAYKSITLEMSLTTYIAYNV